MIVEYIFCLNFVILKFYNSFYINKKTKKMKKRLLYLGIAASMISFNASAQLALENFNAPTLPAGWSLINDGHTVSTSFTGVPGLPASLTANAWVPLEYAVNT